GLPARAMWRPGCCCNPRARARRGTTSPPSLAHPRRLAGSQVDAIEVVRHTVAPDMYVDRGIGCDGGNFAGVQQRDRDGAIVKPDLHDALAACLAVSGGVGPGAREPDRDAIRNLERELSAGLCARGL